MFLKFKIKKSFEPIYNSYTFKKALKFYIMRFALQRWSKLITSIQLLVIVVFNSCSSEKNKEVISNKVFGKWEVKNIQIKFVHAVIDVPLEDMKIPEDKINTHFSFYLKQDSSFVFQNENGAIIKGRYKLKDSTLVFNSPQISWLTLHVDSIVEDRLFLNAKRILFYSIMKDSANIFIGDAVSIVMHKK